MADKNFEAKKGLTVANNVLVSNGSNVGIGTTTPQYTLDVSGDARATGNAIFVYIVANSVRGTDGQSLLSNSTGGIYWGTPASTVAGSNTQVIFNDAGSLAGNAALTFNKSGNNLSVANSIIAGGVVNSQSVVTNSVSVGSASINTTAFTTGNLVMNTTMLALWGGYGGTNLAVTISNTLIGTGNSTAYAYMTSNGGSPSVVAAGNGTVLPAHVIYVLNGGANSKYWRQYGNTTATVFDIVNDTFASGNNWLVATRSAMDISTVYFPSGNVGIGNTAPADKLHVQGNIIASGDITSAYSDDRLKQRFGRIYQPLEKLKWIEGFYYKPNHKALELDPAIDMDTMRVGVSAQQLQTSFPEVVKKSAIGEDYLTVQYDRLVPLLIEAIKELQDRIERLERGS